MTGIIVMGGLCNMLFGLATGETWRRKGIDVVYTNIDTNFIFLTENGYTKIPPLKYQYIFENFDWNAHKCPKNAKLRLAKLPFHYVDIVPEDGIEYHAYFQSEKNFPDKAFIKELFQPSEEIKASTLKYDDLFKGMTCSIHVRRGDYVRQQDLHPVQGMDYYNRAMETMNPFHIERYLVFSDDIPWCRENFKGDQYVFIEDIDYVELFLMGRANHFIVGNSSFSWWGAWLGEKQDSVVVAPQRWLTKPGLDTSDIIPERWAKL
jgi:hypothetical protein